ncbi:hypothetical protein BGW37DRAFT_501103 [Umbelopsis sp. PMI_123]|nr:hypothetical protein BGW37DRAFT_501103 [Umbelopsis sp. PMI_123]
MATGRNRLATLTGDDTFQFTFSIPVPKFNPPQYQRPEKLEPSSDNSTPDSSSSQLLFSLIPDSHDGDGSDESDVGEEEKDNVKYRSSHQKQSDKESAEGGSTANNQDHSSKGKSEKVVVRKLRTRSVIVTGDSSPQAAQSSTRGLTAKSKSIERKRKRETNDENNHHSKHQSDEHNAYMVTKDEDKVPLSKARRSWRSNYAIEADKPGLKESAERYSFSKTVFPTASEPKQGYQDHDDNNYSTEHSYLDKSQSEHSHLEISQLEDSRIESSHLESSQLEDSKIENSGFEHTQLEFRSGYDYFVGVSEEENDDYGYHASDEHEGSGDGVGHILDASDALKMIKQRRQERLSKKAPPQQPQVDSCESLPPSSPLPFKAAKDEKVVPTSKSQDFCYIDSDCEEPPPPPPDSRNDDDGRKLVYVFRGQRYFTDVDLTEIPWAAADSEDEEDLQQIRFKPRVLWPDHPEDVNSRIKLRDTQARTRLL